MLLLAIGFFVMGAGLAVPYALAPRLALSALSPAQAGQGSGIVNACTFLGGSFGVAGGAIAFALGGFVAVLTMIALAGLSAPRSAAGFQRQRIAAPFLTRRRHLLCPHRPGRQPRDPDLRCARRT